MSAQIKPAPTGEPGWIGRIPVRNLWLLMLYASELTQFSEAFDALVNDDVDDLPSVLSRAKLYNMI